MTDDAGTPHVVIIGGGFGGLYAARALRRRAGPGHAGRPPQPPPLPAAALSGGDRRAVAGRHRLADPLDPAPPGQRCACCSAEVESDRPGASACSSADGELVAYDYLIVATGATHSYFGHHEWEPRAPGLKTLEDALEIRRRVLLAFEAAERETDPARAAARC